MSNNLVYMFGKLSKAIEILVAYENDVRSCVWLAARYLQMIQPDGAPESCHENLRWIHKMLVRYPREAPYKSALEATFHRIRNSTPNKITVRLWKLYHIMQTEIENVFMAIMPNKLRHSWPLALTTLTKVCAHARGVK